jgi:hypothetical protein
MWCSMGWDMRELAGGGSGIHPEVYLFSCRLVHALLGVHWGLFVIHSECGQVGDRVACAKGNRREKQGACSCS